MARKHKLLKVRIDGPDAIRVHSPIGNTMLNLTWKCSKSVPNPKDAAKKIKREATITSPFVDPKDSDWIESALEICGGSTTLAAFVFNFGLKSWLRQQETNDLGKVGDSAKSLAKSIAGMLDLGISAEQAKAMILANPEARAKLENESFEQFVSKSISDFAAYQAGKDDKGNTVNRFPDVTVVEDTEAEAETEAEAK